MPPRRRRGVGILPYDQQARTRLTQAGDEARARAQPDHAEDDGEQTLRERVLLEAAEELRADLVARREQEQIEEDDLDERVDLDVQLTDEHAGEQRAHDVARTRPLAWRVSDAKGLPPAASGHRRQVRGDGTPETYS